MAKPKSKTAMRSRRSPADAAAETRAPRRAAAGARTLAAAPDIAVGDAVRDGLVIVVEQGPAIMNKTPAGVGMSKTAWGNCLVKLANNHLRPAGWCLTVNAPLVDKTFPKKFGDTAVELIGLTAPC